MTIQEAIAELTKWADDPERAEVIADTHIGEIVIYEDEDGEISIHIR